MMTKIRAFARFWYDFLVGDDWITALAVVAALALTYLITLAGVASWWVLPAALVIILPLGLRRAIRKR